MTGTVVDLAAQQAAALDLADRGLAVFPVLHRGKRPALSASWTEISTTDPTETSAMFGRQPYNIGVDTGKSRLLVLDEDQPGAVDQLVADLGVPSLSTVTVSTGRGHHYYLWQPDWCPFGNGVGALAGRGIDCRGRGGYVVGPGSTHATGRRYTVADAAPIVAVPGWLADALRPAVRTADRPAVQTRPVSRRAVAAVLDVLLRARDGNRNSACYWTARRLLEKARDGKVDEATAVAMVLDAAAAVGLPAGEATATISSARKAVQRS